MVALVERLFHLVAYVMFRDNAECGDKSADYRYNKRAGDNDNNDFRRKV